jgi:hypothetical protein
LLIDYYGGPNGLAYVTFFFREGAAEDLDIETPDDIEVPAVRNVQIVGAGQLLPPAEHCRLSVMSTHFPSAFPWEDELRIAYDVNNECKWFAEDMMTVRETGGFVEF